MQRCLRYLPLVERWQPNFPHITPEIVFSIAAQESHCDHTTGQYDRVGSIGLMQVAPLPGRPSASTLAQPAVNVYWGMKVLASALETAEGDMRLALAAYNCGFKGVYEDKCGSKGGYAYADKVLNVWMPLAREMLAPTPVPVTGEPMDTDQWLQEMGILPTEAPTATLTPTPTPKPSPTPSVVAVEDTQKKENDMQLDPAVQQAVVVIISLIVGWFGPQPLKQLYDLLNLKGKWAAAVTVGISVVIGAVGAFGATALGWQPASPWGLAVAVLLASQFAYHRLKDAG